MREKQLKIGNTMQEATLLVGVHPLASLVSDFCMDDSPMRLDLQRVNDWDFDMFQSRLEKWPGAGAR